MSETKTKEELDRDHIIEKQKALQEMEGIWEGKKEMRRQLQQDIDGKQKQLTLLNNELKTKQALLKRINDKSGPILTADELQREIKARDSTIDQLSDKVIVQDHELKNLKVMEEKLDQLKALEKQLDEKDHAISEHKKKQMLQEESISGWMEALEAKKRLLQNKDIQVKDQLRQIDGLAEEIKGLKEMVFNYEKDASDKDDEKQKQALIVQQEITFLKDLNKKLQAKVSTLETEQSQHSKDLKEKHLQVDEMRQKQLDDMEQIDKLEVQLAAANHQIIDLTKGSSDLQDELSLEQQKQKKELADIRVQRDHFEKQLKIVENAYSEYQKQKKIEDLLTVRFDILSLDEQKLLDPKFEMQDLENEKSLLEDKIGNISTEFGIVISVEKKLSEKVKLFQTKCKELEEKLLNAQSVSSAEVRALKREITTEKDKSATLEQNYQTYKQEVSEQMNQQFEQMKRQKQEIEEGFKNELQKGNSLLKEKADLLREAQQQESILRDNLQKKEDLISIKDQKEKSLQQDKNSLQAKVNQNKVDIDDLKVKVKQLTGTIEDLNRENQRIKVAQKKGDKQKLFNLEQRNKEQEAELEILKEMVKGAKIQIKSKDTDIQRLNIKIKRLEKTAEIREQVVQETIAQASKVNKQAHSPRQGMQKGGKQYSSRASGLAQEVTSQASIPSSLPPIQKPPVVGGVVAPATRQQKTALQRKSSNLRMVNHSSEIGFEQRRSESKLSMGNRNIPLAKNSNTSNKYLPRQSSNEDLLDGSNSLQKLEAEIRSNKQIELIKSSAVNQSANHLRLQSDVAFSQVDQLGPSNNNDENKQRENFDALMEQQRQIHHNYSQL